MKYVNTYLIILVTFYLFSCNDKEGEYNIIDPSLSLIEMEGEGGEAEISFTNAEWRIARVINQNGNVSISGDIYSLDGSQIQKNDMLKLDGLGRVDAIWTNKGFQIIRDSDTSLKVKVKENRTKEDFNFAIILESNDDSKKIQVEQKKSQGYTFKKIEYELNKSDGDSIFVKQGSSFLFNVPSSNEFTFHPINGIDIVKTSFFKSTEEDAFVWTESDSVLVKIPSVILNDELFFNGDEALYTGASVKNDSEYSNRMETVTVPSGESGFSIKVQYRARRVSYFLYLENNRTKKEKVIKGKWIEYAPTGDYTLIWEN